jgi:uncharacterized membrane protein
MNSVTLPHEWGHDTPLVSGQEVRPGDVCEQASAQSLEPAGHQWQLQRRCALSPRQFGACFLALAGLSAAVALFFWVLGAPFVTFFAGFEVLALGMAFACHAVHASDGERLQLHGDRLLVEQRHGLTQRRERLELASLRVGEGEDGLLELHARGRCVRVGRHAHPTQRRQVLAELRQLVLRPVAPGYGQT